MNTILNLSNHLKKFGDHMITNGELKPEYAELIALLAIVGFTSVVLILFERRN